MAASLPLLGCAGSGIGDQLPPAMGGLPEGAPARPAEPYQYPAVYDTPPDRSDKTLDAEGQLSLQRDLQNLRARQQKVTAEPDDPDAPETPPTPRKQAKQPSRSDTSGAKTNP